MMHHDKVESLIKRCKITFKNLHAVLLDDPR
jgi:hypothetical protein